MPAHAEFEEREFETPLYHQLKVADNHVWSPGQVLEHRVGFDYSALCVDSYFWAIHGLRGPYSGLMLDEIFHRRIWRRSNISRPLPNFALNLFLQAKRPEVRARLTKALKGGRLTAPYWRIGINADQQNTLERLSRGTRGKALICYATPAFDRLSQLYSHTSSGTIVSHSSFPEARWLIGHDAWNYDSPGAKGVANAEPVEFDEADLLARIARLVNENMNSVDTAYDANLVLLAKIVTACAEGAQQQEGARTALFFQRMSEIDAYMNPFAFGRYGDAIRSYMVVLAFITTFQLQWFVLGGTAHA
jgi:hypothetical protein